MRAGLLLFIEGVGLLLLGGIPAVFNFMDLQGFPLQLPTTFFRFHWFIMVYGFFLTLIGNEVLVSLSVEWRGSPAPDLFVVSFGAVVLAANLSSIFGVPEVPFYLVDIALVLLLWHSKVYLSSSAMGLKPRPHNYLLFLTLEFSAFVASVEAVVQLPWLSLSFPVLTVFSVVVRDIGLVLGGRRIKGGEIAVSFLLVLIGITTYTIPQVSSLFLVAGWALSLHGSGLLRSRGRLYPRLSLIMAWSWLLLGGILSRNYDVFVHSLAVGFLFNVVFGVDSVLADALLSLTGTRVRLKPSYVPLVLLNFGLVLRFAFDFGLSFPIVFSAAPLQGLGILYFFASTLTQVLRQVRKVEKRASLTFKGETTHSG
ncbi:hypothetical protein HS1genome_2028 [Sulfodiicoccus acidiphilus]|uniref:Nitric oxide response protein n=1 Tax=Sulfodiicoccus acidiphilus TaxID=1670455 RepID=A0A348B637_9CREN|nr:nitric oxide response protein [Sulfodiicoccus acidiphilus]BBD73639.1 hypothetical protein HS1genome_2028 [Sulfodiicoccus acidiphilus]GGU02128.1 hypothetical protein GCM10007116_19070 [Sulfodiicoccus acidiphilus]